MKKVLLQSKIGFTLIELLVVISVIGILAAFAIASFSSAQARGRDAKRKGDLDAISKALQLYYSDNGEYPAASCASSWSSCWSNSSGNPWLGANASSYIKEIPLDPKNNVIGNICTAGNTSTVYSYYSALGSDYFLIARLENNLDPAINYDGTASGGCTGFGNYRIENP